MRVHRSTIIKLALGCALAPFTVVVLVLGIMLFQYYESIPVELAGNLRFEITIVYLPIMYLALAVFGLAWAPFGAFISSRFARGTAPRRPTSYPRTKQMDLRLASETASQGPNMALVGATYSATFLLPWIYHVLQMRGKRVWRPAIWLAYFLLYASWVLGPISWLLVGSVLSTTLGGQQATSLLSVMFWGPCLLMAVAWCASLYLLLSAAFNLKRTTKATVPQVSLDWSIPRVYYAPYALSFASLVMFVLVVIIFAFGT